MLNGNRKVKVECGIKIILTKNQQQHGPLKIVTNASSINTTKARKGEGAKGGENETETETEI